MNTRNNGSYTKGNYTKELVSGSLPICNKRKRTATIRRSHSAFITNIKLFVIKGLKWSKSPIRRATVEITQSFQNWLVSNYNLTHKVSKQHYIYKIQIYINIKYFKILSSSDMMGFWMI
jgi:hypothetical protein